MTVADVTAVVLTRDEERNLPRALTSLPKGMPVLVLDACSSDRTVEFARGAGARVVERPWTDYLDARRFALQRVETPWALMLDADEALDDELRDALTACSFDADAYEVSRTTYFCGKPMRLWTREPLLRILRVGRIEIEARPAAGGDAALHERWRCEGRVESLPGTLLHFSYPDVASYRAKYERYTGLEAAALRPSWWRLLRSIPVAAFAFARSLLVRGALLDGPRGVYVAWRSALYPCVVAWKALSA
ncbi:MAG TPA: glycosyltransferase family 2 protein [Candidatus Acidoferrales bacterium]|nr:glycosyltransferase family 2 protein [Candidatus Acidoferrales bacterium]